MTSLRNIALAVLVAAVVGSPATAGDNISGLAASQRELASLHRQEAGVRERIGRFQLDALVASLVRTTAPRKDGAMVEAGGSRDLERLIARLQ